MWKLKTTGVYGSLNSHIRPGVHNMFMHVANKRKRCIPGHREDRTHAGKKSSCVNVRDLPSTMMLDRQPDDWTENAMYKYFTDERTHKYPKLVEITEMLIRLQGVHKFKCHFLNNKGESCHTWVSATIIYRCYPIEYSQYLDVFWKKLQRTHQLSSRMLPH
jgi:hypothetical protein